MTQKVTPLLKCFVLFLFIFTAKVLTSRPNEAHDLGNGIQHVKPAHYVRTFTKYHHRRTIQWNNDELNYWPVTQDQPKVIEKRNYWPVTQDQAKVIKKRSESDWPKIIRKRNIEVPYSNYKRNKRSVEFTDSNEVGVGIPNLIGFGSNLVNLNLENNSDKEEHSTKNSIANEVEKYQVKAAIVITDAPTTIGPTISCLYKIHSVSMSVTPSYKDDPNAQFMVENDSYGM